ncbi:hypothetical protein P7K49_038219 [Saguinus oedipus]|uniref:Dystrophin n=1 Tax=Saguinus oedipus TaxID=9490 RepID=A0ABQ9TE14_SAGOE|nr:hypothetical protein P7K49_038219 [Saguinus oedipus]
MSPPRRKKHPLTSLNVWNLKNTFTENDYLNEFVLWLEKADNIARIPPEPGNEQQLKEKLEQVKLLVEELPLRQGILKQLNETGGPVLVSAPISPEEQDKLENKLKQTNLQWIKIGLTLTQKSKQKAVP